MSVPLRNSTVCFIAKNLIKKLYFIDQETTTCKIKLYLFPGSYSAQVID